MSNNSFFLKKISEISYSDIEDLIIRRTSESYMLDYKEMYPRHLSNVMVSFANASGGYIIIGIDEEKENGKNTGIPKSIIGVNLEDHETRITNIAISHSQPKIIPKVKTIPIPNTDKVLVVIKIKESLEPIMETNSSRFYIRINDQSLPADQSIVKKLFNKEQYQIEKRIQKLYNLISDLFEKIEVIDATNKGGYVEYEIQLKNIGNAIGESHLELQREIQEFQEIFLVFKDDLKYFGANEKTPLSFYFGRYTLKQNRFIIILLQFAPPDEREIFEVILNDLKKFAKKYFSIDL